MKWLFSTMAGIIVAILSFASLSTALAERQDDTIKVFQFRVSSPNYVSLDGKYLSFGARPNASADVGAGVYSGGFDEDAMRVYASRGRANGTFQLGVCPIGIIHHGLVLLGPRDGDGHAPLEMRDVVNPDTTVYPAGTTAMWSAWKLEGVPDMATSEERGAGNSYKLRRGRAWARERGDVEGMDDGPGPIKRKKGGAKNVGGGKVTYADGSNSSRWLAFPANGKGDYIVRWDDGKGFLTQDYIPVEIYYEAVPGSISVTCPF